MRKSEVSEGIKKGRGISPELRAKQERSKSDDWPKSEDWGDDDWPKSEDWLKVEDWPEVKDWLKVEDWPEVEDWENDF